MNRSPSINEYELTVRYGNLLLHQERVVAASGGLHMEAERVANIAKKMLMNRNMPHFHDEIVVKSGCLIWEFKR